MGMQLGIFDSLINLVLSKVTKTQLEIPSVELTQYLVLK